jgi:hypothetical protein
LIFLKELDMTHDEIETLARKRANSKAGWFLHVTAYLLVNAVLVSLSVWQGRNWSIFPALGWGLGLLIHGMAVWFTGVGSALRERLVARERRALLAQRDPW